MTALSIKVDKNKDNKRMKRIIRNETIHIYELYKVREKIMCTINLCIFFLFIIISRRFRFSIIINY